MLSDHDITFSVYVCIDGQGLGRKMIRKLVTKKFGEEVYGWASLNSQKKKKCDDTCVPCRCSPKGDFSRGRL